MSDDSIINFITTFNLGKYKLSKDEVILGCPFTTCPNHGEQQFYINRNTEEYYCHRCSAKGNTLKTLAFQLGLIQFTQPTKAAHIFVPITEIESYQSALQVEKSALEYLTKRRGFKPSTLKQFRLGYKLVEGQGAIVIPYFDKNKACVGMKYDFYNRPKGIEKYRKERGTKTELFNIAYINVSSPVIITEGEYDTMSLWQYGYTNVGSLPNGAMGINGWLEGIMSAKEFILCLDADEAGYECSVKLGNELGLSKCKQVFPRLKDVNEYLQHGLDKSHIDLIFQQATPMFNAPVTSIGTYKEEAIDYLKDPIKNKGVSTGWAGVDYFLGGIRTGEVTVISGLTGHGKTTWGLALANNLVRQGMNVLIISPEMKEQALLIDLANGYYKKQVNEKELTTFIDENNSKIYIAKVFDNWTDKKKKKLLERIFDIVDYSVRNNNVQYVLIDHLRLFLNPESQDGERFAIDEFVQKCVHTALTNNVHIALVVQPKNLMASQKKLTIHDLKGSSNIAQDAHNVILIHRDIDKKKHENQVELDIVKNRELGLTGTTVLEFNLNSRNNYGEV